MSRPAARQLSTLFTRTVAAHLTPAILRRLDAMGFAISGARRAGWWCIMGNEATRMPGWPPSKHSEVVSTSLVEHAISSGGRYDIPCYFVHPVFVKDGSVQIGCRSMSVADVKRVVLASDATIRAAKSRRKNVMVKVNDTTRAEVTATGAVRAHLNHGFYWNVYGLMSRKEVVQVKRYLKVSGIWK